MVLQGAPSQIGKTFKIHFISFNYSCSTSCIQNSKSPVSNSPATSLQLYENFCIFSQVFHSPVCLFLSNLSFNKETKKNLAKISQCAIRTPQQAIQNIQYLFFFSIKKSPHDISLKKSLTDRQYSIKCSKKVHKAVFSLVTFRFFKKRQ